MMTVIRIRNIQDSNPFGCAPFVVIVFYDAVLLFLTSKEAKVASEGRRALVVSTDDGQGQAEKDDEKDEGIVAIAHLRQTLNFWVCAVCQSGIAASVLYEAGRLALLLRAPTMLTLPDILTGYIDLLASVGQIGVLSYATLWAIVLQIVRSSTSRAVNRLTCITEHWLLPGHRDL